MKRADGSKSRKVGGDRFWSSFCVLGLSHSVVLNTLLFLYDKLNE